MPVDVPVLTIADSEDGTGATATIAGSTAGSTNTVYSQLINGQLGSSTWTNRGNRTGDGTVALSITTTGFYWFKCVTAKDGESDVSNLVYGRVSDGADPIHRRFIDAVQSRIQLLTLSGISDSDVVVREIITDLEGHVPSQLPAIVVGLAGRETISPGAGTNDKDDVGYPVAVCVFAAANRDLTANINLHLKWREQLVRAFHNQQLGEVAECKICYVEPDTIVPLGPWLKNLLATSFIVRCMARQTRGLTT